MATPVGTIPSAVAKENDGKSVTLGSTRTGFVMLAFGTFMSLALALTILLGIGDGLKLMTLRWTWRLPGTDFYDTLDLSYAEVHKSYTENTLTTKEGLSSVMIANFKAAGCLASHFDGGIEWSPGSVSPTCHCLRNFHLEYIKAVTPRGVPLNPTEMQTQDTKDRVAEMLKLIKSKCFTAIRHTQFERIDKQAGSNLVIVAACWNVIAMACLFYVYKSMRHHEGTPTTTMEYGFNMVMFATLVVAMIAALAANGEDSTFVGWVQCIVTLVYLLVVIYYAMNKPTEISNWTNYWYACLFFLPFLAQALNGVMQRRDAWCNHLTGVMTASICLVSVAIGFMQSDDGGVMKSIKGLSAASAGLMVIATFTFTFPSFPTTPFFNMQFTMLVVAGLLAFPAIYNVVFLHDPRGPGNKGGEDLKSHTFFSRESCYEVFVVEFLARVIFTFSVMSDLWSMQGSDLIRMH